MKRMRGNHNFLTRLRHDTAGNTIALVAAAILPLVGMIGGAVDMSRLYLVKTRLQQACDAGALAGRKAMGGGGWTTGENNDSTEDTANKLFNANFVDGAYGTGPLTNAFEEEDGVVTGSASVTVPMTLMRVFNMNERTVAVSCTSKMEIPNTDVMFVLDVTGSMDTDNKIGGLKKAVKCFYEALLRVDTTEVCGNDPSATEATTTAQIRMGFVPYSVNVNVGRLLPQNFMADSWTYQSRVATTSTVHAWSTGTERAVSNWGSWSIPTGDLITTTGYNSFSIVSGANTSTTTLADGQSYLKLASASTESLCNGLNKLGGGTQLVGVKETYSVSNPTSTNPAPSYTPTNNNPPVYPANQQNLNASQSRTATVGTGYRYRWFKNGSTTACWLESASAKTASKANQYTQTRTGTSDRAINWTDYQQIDYWTYKPISFSQIANLKEADEKWATSVSLPIGQTSVKNLKLSGSNSNVTINVPQDRDVTWNGCIEERHTFQNIDGTPGDEWSPIPTDALDMNINLIPSLSTAHNSFWGPLLNGATWARYDWNLSDCTKSGRTTDNVNTSCNASTSSASCPTEARKLTTYNTPGPFETYVDSLSTGGNTYHDIGMLWGARLMSPTGIFADENDFTEAGRPIQRHLIFMTDGDTNTSNTDYSAYGIGFYNRLQTLGALSDTEMDNMNNARTAALCSAIKNMNITLWVISYGTGVGTKTETRLENCASPGRYYKASNGDALISRFRQIASEISELRLVN